MNTKLFTTNLKQILMALALGLGAAVFAVVAQTGEALLDSWATGTPAHFDKVSFVLAIKTAIATAAVAWFRKWIMNRNGEILKKD
jgi:hypothetical protein